MNIKTIGCVELNSIAIGIQTADEMIKAASVELVMSRPTCPGRYLVIVTGDTGAVKSSVQCGLNFSASAAIDWFVISNLHEDVFPAINGGVLVPKINALGVIETYTTAAGILAADSAAKAGVITLIDIRFAAGMAGKTIVTLTGEVSSVKSAVEAGINGVGECGPVLSHVVIPAPSEELKAQLF